MEVELKYLEFSNYAAIMVSLCAAASTLTRLTENLNIHTEISTLAALHLAFPEYSLRPQTPTLMSRGTNFRLILALGLDQVSLILTGPFTPSWAVL